MTYDEQLQKWLAGQSVHMGERPDGQCCPDFSCCQPQLLAPEAERRVFVERPEVRDQLCMGFLGRALAEMGKADEVHIAGSIEGMA